MRVLHVRCCVCAAFMFLLRFLHVRFRCARPELQPLLYVSHAGRLPWDASQGTQACMQHTYVYCMGWHAHTCRSASRW